MSWASVRVWDFGDDSLAICHYNSVCLVVVALANLVERYTLVRTDGLARNSLKTGHIKMSVSNFQLLSLVPELLSAGVAEQDIHFGLRMEGNRTAILGNA